MRAFAGIAVFTVAWLGMEAGVASAAWDNVFQTCCNSCRSAPRTSFFAPAPSACCPSVSYQQRCCYQPYTAFRQESFMEPVTSYRTSYFWEATTNYTYTSFFDPCTGCCKQVCTPVQSFSLRSQCNAVQSYVQRCRMVPYTAYRQSCYMEPVVSMSPACPTCPSTGNCPTANCPTGNCPTAAAQEQPATQEPGPAPRQPLPGVSEDNSLLPKQNLPNSRNRVAPGGSPVRMDRVASNTSNGRLQGTVISDDRITPKSGARILFTSSTNQQSRFTAQADATGRFQVELPAGDWDLAMITGNGQTEYHSQISVQRNDDRLVTVVSR